MWVSRHFHELALAALKAETTAQTQIVALERQLAQMQTAFDWMAQRVNGLELDRAALLVRLGVGVGAAPQIRRAAPEPTEAQTDRKPPDAYEAMSFEDIGDEAASELHIPTVPVMPV